MSDTWQCLHFSMSNPVDDGAEDLPRLLRRLADQIEERDIKPMDILDLNIESKIIAEGPRWSGSLYWSPDTADAEPETTPPPPLPRVWKPRAQEAATRSATVPTAQVVLRSRTPLHPGGHVLSTAVFTPPLGGRMRRSRN